MIRDLYALSTRLQDQLLQAASSLPADTWANQAPRVLLDAWASLVRWHECGERVWRITPAAADETADMLLPADLPLATAPVRAEAVCYQLPDRSQWIIIARHTPAPCEVVVRGGVRFAYAQPVLTYCTLLADDTLASGFASLVDQPTPVELTLAPGHRYGRTLRALTEAECAEEDYRMSLALLHHYFPQPSE